jgi:hypothetical protein
MASSHISSHIVEAQDHFQPKSLLLNDKMETLLLHHGWN